MASFEPDWAGVEEGCATGWGRCFLRLVLPSGSIRRAAKMPVAGPTKGRHDMEKSMNARE
jgi:hypothetical protein